MKTVKFTEVVHVEDIPKTEFSGDYSIIAYEFKGDCVILTFCSFDHDLFKWCESLDSAKEFYNKWKELRK